MVPEREPTAQQNREFMREFARSLLHASNSHDPGARRARTKAVLFLNFSMLDRTPPS